MAAPHGASTRFGPPGRHTLLFAGTLLPFAPTLLGYVETWLGQADKYGLVIACAVVWLCWRARDALRPATAGWAPGRYAVAAATIVWLAAAIMNVGVVEQATLPVLLLAWAGAAYGRGPMLAYLPIAATFLLAIPLWDVLAGPLQRATVAASSVVLRIADVPARIEANAIAIEYGTFLIEGGCAGLNYLLGGVGIAALYGLVFLHGWSARVVAVGVVGAVAIVGNWIRVSSLILIGHATRMESGLMDDHLLYGWGIFLLGMIACFSQASRLERWDRARARSSQSESAASRGEAAASVDDGARGSLWRRASLASGLAVAGPVLYLGVGALPSRDPDAFPVPEAPPRWLAAAGPGAAPFDWRPSFPGADAQERRVWTSGDRAVVLDHVLFVEQRQGAELVGYSGRIAGSGSILSDRLVGPLGPERRFVNEIIVRAGSDLVLARYWYRVGGVPTEAPARAKLLELPAFFRRATSAELVAFSAACGPESCVEAAQGLTDFMEGVARY